jgi:phosphoribosylformimino-5-aminoimidazole carboxamide ribotide isomerase
MIIIPAVDIKQGKCVRLLQGRMEDATQYADDPAAMAVKWEKQGAQMIHVVDLDGAFAKCAVNFDSIAAILDQVTVPIQVGGGIRDLDTIEKYLAAGVFRVIIGSEALYRPEFVKQACKLFAGKIVVGIDARDGMVAVEGWSKTSETRAKTWQNNLKLRVWPPSISRISTGTGCRPGPIYKKPQHWHRRCPYR